MSYIAISLASVLLLVGAFIYGKKKGSEETEAKYNKKALHVVEKAKDTYNLNDDELADRLRELKER